MSLAEPDLDYLIRTFHPGFMDTPEPDTLPKGATPDARNCLLGSVQIDPPRAVLEKRTAASLLTTAKVDGANGFDGLCEFRKTGQSSGRIVAVLNGKVWYWDNVSAFVQIGVTAPFAVGTKVRFNVQRNLLFIMDGITTRCWDGVLANDLFTPGQIAPTAAPALAVAAGPGVTGTYEGFGTWYSTSIDHESSPSAFSAAVVFANQQRNWTKPAGAPSAIYDRWRIYCRRVDTNEAQYWRVVDTAIATAAVTEAVTDSARRLSTLGPLPLTNNPQPLTFEFQAEHLGYRLGVIGNDDQIYVSRLGYPVSQHPNDVIGVSRGVGGELRSIAKFGEEVLAQKPSKSYRLDGDRMPFQPKEVHPTLGNVGAMSAVQTKDWFYAWDEEHGPYRTNLSTWDPIASTRIRKLVKAVPKAQAKHIECVFLKSMDLVIWSVPQGLSSRRRMLLPWHTELETWLPPMSGLEYAALASFIDSNGDTQLYVGDYWGRLFQYFTGDVEGVPSGSLLGHVSGATANTVTCDRQIKQDGLGFADDGAIAFYTVGAGLAGIPVLHIDANGAQQWRRIESNTASVLTLDTTNDSPWTRQPVAGDVIVVGGIDWYWRSPLIDWGEPYRQKKGGRLEIHARSDSADFIVMVRGYREDFRQEEFGRTFEFANAGGIWGLGLWGVMKWGGVGGTALKTRLMRAFFSLGFEISNPFPNKRVVLQSARVTADKLRKRLRGSGGS